MSNTTARQAQGPSPELASALLPRLWAGDPTLPGVSARLEVGIICALHHTL